jgi:putative SOS response-associated peptidase YedK
MFGVSVDNTGNLPPQSGVYPDYFAPIVRNSADGRELVVARWGMPTPPKFLVTGQVGGVVRPSGEWRADAPVRL